MTFDAPSAARSTASTRARHPSASALVKRSRAACNVDAGSRPHAACAFARSSRPTPTRSCSRAPRAVRSRRSAPSPRRRDRARADPRRHDPSARPYGDRAPSARSVYDIAMSRSPWESSARTSGGKTSGIASAWNARPTSTAAREGAHRLGGVADDHGEHSARVLEHQPQLRIGIGVGEWRGPFDRRGRLVHLPSQGMDDREAAQAHAEQRLIADPLARSRPPRAPSPEPRRSAPPAGRACRRGCRAAMRRSAASRPCGPTPRPPHSPR